MLLLFLCKSWLSSVWRVQSLFFPKASWNVHNLTTAQVYTVSLSMRFGPDDLEAFLHRNDVWLSLCEKSVSLHKILPSPWEFIYHSSLMVFHIMASEDSNVRHIQQWFLNLTNTEWDFFSYPKLRNVPFELTDNSFIMFGTKCWATHDCLQTQFMVDDLFILIKSILKSWPVKTSKVNDLQFSELHFQTWASSGQ